MRIMFKSMGNVDVDARRTRRTALHTPAPPNRPDFVLALEHQKNIINVLHQYRIHHRRVLPARLLATRSRRPITMLFRPLTPSLPLHLTPSKFANFL
jgi:hypothetical protein